MSLIDQLNSLPEADRAAFLHDARLMLESRDAVASERENFDRCWAEYRRISADPNATYEEKSSALKAVRLIPDQQPEEPAQ